MSTIEFAIILILVLSIVAVSVSYYYALDKGKGLSGQVSTKGMNGLAGQTVNMSCPSGQVISFSKINNTSTRGSLVCLGDSSCDAFYQPSGQNTNFFNPSTTVDVFSSSSQFKDIQACEGQQNCSWTIPTSSDTRLPTRSTNGGCLTSCKQLAFIGTYDCISP